MTRSSGSCGSPLPPCAWPRVGFAPTSARASRYSLCRPSSDRATDRRSSLAVQPSSGFRPGRLARLHGRLSWVFQPPRLHAFSAQRREPSPPVDVTPRGVSSCADRRATSPPEGLACRRRWTLARHLSCAFSLAAEVACAGAPESASPSEVASSFEAAIPFRGSWFVVVPPDEDRHYATSRSRGKRLTRCPQLRARAIAFVVARLSRKQEASKVFHTAIHSLWKRARRRER